MTNPKKQRRKRVLLNMPINGEVEGKYSNPDDWNSIRNWADADYELELKITLRFRLERCGKDD